MKTKTEQAYLLAINLLPGLGPRVIKKLWEQFSSAEEAFNTPCRRWNNLSPSLKVKLNQETKQQAIAQAEETLEKVNQKGYKILSWWDLQYPYRLKQCADPPTLMFYKGEANFNAKRILSIVGTRSATRYGKDFCTEFVAELKPLNCTIISGLAAGIDAAVHQACIENQIPTIAVLGNSLDFTYPAANRSLSRKIEKDHCLLTEFPINTKPDRGNFPMRNRIVAGMSDATVVIEAAAKGGALITADLAFSYNREVFALPGRVNDHYSEGCNALIRYQKAQILRSAKDLAVSLNWSKSKVRSKQMSLLPDLNELEKLIFDTLQSELEMERDLLAEKLKLNTSTILVEITNLELKGLVKSLPGNRYALA